MSAEPVGFSFIIIGLLLLVGKCIRTFTPFLQIFFIPSSMIGGLIALLPGPEVLGVLGVNVFDDGGILPAEMIEVWSVLPDLLISVIFAPLFLGQTIPNIKEIWKVSSPSLIGEPGKEKQKCFKNLKIYQKSKSRG